MRNTTHNPFSVGCDATMILPNGHVWTNISRPLTRYHPTAIELMIGNDVTNMILPYLFC
jgi:hypothetical protein